MDNRKTAVYIPAGIMLFLIMVSCLNPAKAFAAKVKPKEIKAAVIDECIIPWKGNKSLSVMVGRKEGSLCIMQTGEGKNVKEMDVTDMLETEGINSGEFVISDICPAEEELCLVGYSKKGKAYIIENARGRDYEFSRVKNLKAATGDSISLTALDKGYLIIHDNASGQAFGGTQIYYSKDIKKWRKITLPVQKNNKKIKAYFLGYRNEKYYFYAENEKTGSSWQYYTKDFKKFKRTSYFPGKYSGVTGNGISYGIKENSKYLKLRTGTGSSDKMAERLSISYPDGRKKSLNGVWGIFTPKSISFFVDDMEGAHMFLSDGSGEKFKKYSTKLKAGDFQDSGIYRGRYCLACYDKGLIATRDGFKSYIEISLSLENPRVCCIKKRELISGYAKNGKYVTYSLGTKDWVDAVASSLPDS